MFTNKPLQYFINGFTLIELLIVLALLGILSSVAIPSYSEQMKRDRLVSNANKLHSTFKFARSEAAKRDEIVDLNLSDGGWEVKRGNNILQKFTPHNTIEVTNLANLQITSTGETDAIKYEINYIIPVSGITKFCLTILPSGQSSLIANANCIPQNV
jgi:type IV fimbrial biogenesis protein FimT